jgi:hypothetical protein
MVLAGSKRGIAFRGCSLATLMAVIGCQAGGGTPGGATPPESASVGATISATPGTSPTGVACADFTADPHDTQMGNNFTRNGFVFTSLDTSHVPFVNDIDPGVIGLQFGDGGLDVTLAAKTPRALLDAGAWAQDVLVTAYSSTGSVMATLTVPKRKAVDHFELLGRGSITRLTMTGGNNEGLLAKICVDIG